MRECKHIIEMIKAIYVDCVQKIKTCMTSEKANNLVKAKRNVLSDESKLKYVKYPIVF